MSKSDSRKSPNLEEQNGENTQLSAMSSNPGFIDRVKETRTNSSGVLEFLKNFVLLILGTLGCTICAALSFAVPVSMIIVGSVYLHNCPREKHIPIYLIVGGVFGAFKNLLAIYASWKQRQDTESGGGPAAGVAATEQPPINKGKTVVERIFDLFLFIWFICGCVWIYRIYQPSYNEKDGLLYCNKVVYLYAFWLNTISFIIFAACCCCCCCLIICAAFSDQS